MSDTTAAQRGWGSGWPHCQASKMTTIRPCGVALSVRKEAAVALDYLVRRFDAEVENVNAGRDDWGFACRPIRGSNPPRPSNHSWGLAVDLNSVQHQLGATGTFTETQVLFGHLMCVEMKWVRWGLDYRDRKDPMHWELLGTPTDIAGLTRRIKGLVAWAPFDGHVLKVGSHGPRVAMVQSRLGQPLTGQFNAKTASLVRWFQTTRHLDDDGKVGPDTWKHLEWKLR